MLARDVPKINGLDSDLEIEYPRGLRTEAAFRYGRRRWPEYGPMNPRVWIGPASEHRQEEPFEGGYERLRLVDEHVLGVQPALEDQQ
jgi:hypothetical protein